MGEHSLDICADETLDELDRPGDASESSYDFLEDDDEMAERGDCVFMVWISGAS